MKSLNKWRSLILCILIPVSLKIKWLTPMLLVFRDVCVVPAKRAKVKVNIHFLCMSWQKRTSAWGYLVSKQTATGGSHLSSGLFFFQHCSPGQLKVSAYILSLCSSEFTDNRMKVKALVCSRGRIPVQYPVQLRLEGDNLCWELCTELARDPLTICHGENCSASYSVPFWFQR